MIGKAQWLLGQTTLPVSQEGVEQSLISAVRAKKKEMTATLLNNVLISNDVALIALLDAYHDVPLGARETEITLIFSTNGVTFGDDDDDIGIGGLPFMFNNLRRRRN